MNCVNLNESNKYYINITIYFNIQTLITLLLYFFLRKFNFSFLFSGVPLIFYLIISIVLFIDIYFIINYIYFKVTNVKSGFIITFFVFKILELFFLLFISQYIQSKFIYYVYISLSLSFLIHSIILLIFNNNGTILYINITILITIINIIVFPMFYIFKFFKINLATYLTFMILYSIFLFLFCGVNYELIFNHEEDKSGYYILFSSLLVYFGIFIFLFQKIGVIKINN